ncbi:MAG: DUF814 domain-containing protein [Flavobacteriales bacterium]|nr:DUF814 domain-containing protein [Bacteroidota bacterium]MCB9239757.1 DUF814 domain-containing protein [Flavobacteriales bacterium]
MINDPVFLYDLAHEVDEQLRGSELRRCFSASPTDIYLEFTNESVFRICFVRDLTLFLFPEADRLPIRNTIPQFREIIGQQVVRVCCPLPDRRLILEFEHHSLGVQAFGRHSGMLAYHQNEVSDFFKYKSAPEALPETPHISFHPSPADFAHHNPFATANLIHSLEQLRYFEHPHHNESVFLEAIDLLNHQGYRIVEESDEVVLRTANPGEGEVIHSAKEAAEAFSINWLRLDRIHSTRKQIEDHINQRRAKTRKQLHSLEKKKSSLPDESFYRQRADTLMAHIHFPKESRSEIELTNVYTNEPITIRLNKDLSLADNARNYYRKAKNSHLEISHLNSRYVSLQHQEAQLDLLEMEYRSLNTLKELQQFASRCGLHAQEQKQPEAVPYRVYEHDGFEIWVGKSARDNDELLKRAGKTDHWLHAREVAGSHVIIRNPTQKTIPEHVLEYAGSLAAGYSKNQHESLSAVIHTPIKFVRKFKGAHPGQVRVDRESVILVPPQK